MVMTSVWLFKPRSHGRKMEGARVRNGAPLPGRLPSFLLAPSIGVFGFVPVWARSIFSSSCVVVRAWCLVPVVRRRVRGTSGRSASAACGVRGVRAAQQRGSRQCDNSAERVAEAPSSRCVVRIRVTTPPMRTVRLARSS